MTPSIPPGCDPLASPFELAQLAVSIASMRGRKEPDMKGAIELLREAALRVQEEIRPRKCYADAIYQDQGGAFLPPHPGTKVITPDTDPVAWKKHIDEMRNFPGGDKIAMPKTERFTMLQIVAAVTGRKEKKRNEAVIQKMLDAGACRQESLSWHHEGEMCFWSVAERIAPFAPRFKTLYAKQKADAKPGKQQRRSGKFHKSKRTGSGNFKKI